MSGISFNQMNASIGKGVDTMETEFAAAANKMKENPTSTAAMMEMQQKMQQWSVMVNLQSTVIKEVGDALKGIIQKSG